MSDGDALLAAVVAAPDDDAPRLVYADWLDIDAPAAQRDPERAEFIRVQIELARLSAGWRNGPGSPNGIDPNGPGTRLRHRERELFRGRFDWLAIRIPQTTRRTVDATLTIIDGDGDRLAAMFARGFVGAVTCTAADWLAQADALTWHPSQTAGCPERKDPKLGVFHNPRRGGLDFDMAKAHERCERCGGTGRVSRPCPPTAHPVREVRLTTWPRWPTFTRRDYDWLGDTYLEDCRRRWPSVETWHLPDPPEPHR